MSCDANCRVWNTLSWSSFHTLKMTISMYKYDCLKFWMRDMPTNPHNNFYFYTNVYITTTPINESLYSCHYYITCMTLNPYISKFWHNKSRWKTHFCGDTGSIKNCLQELSLYKYKIQYLHFLACLHNSDNELLDRTIHILWAETGWPVTTHHFAKGLGMSI
jgi:uncharacterized protein VirK/YbjX